MAAKASRVVVVAANMVLSSLPLSIDVDSYLGGERTGIYDFGVLIEFIMISSIVLHTSVARTEYAKIELA